MTGIEQWCALCSEQSTTKLKEVVRVDCSPKQSYRHFTEPPLTAGVERVSSINVLGVRISNDLSNGLNTERILHKAYQPLYALIALKAYGLSPGLLTQVCAATIVSHRTYAGPSCYGSITTEGFQRLQAVLNRAHRWGLSGFTHFDLHNLLDAADKRLFKSVLHSPVHILHRLLPPPVVHKYVLRRRVHNRSVPIRGVYTISSTLLRVCSYPIMVEKVALCLLFPIQCHRIYI